jgi:hypothetical protein
MGLRAVGFKSPTDNELAHDYLWRVHQHVPVLGEIAIFNRSHYEDVLITRVQGWIDDEECQRRCAQIRDFERMLAETGTVIIKVFLHISKEEQRERLQERLDDPDKQWKFNPEDIKQRAKWNDYQRVYEKAIRETDAPHAVVHRAGQFQDPSQPGDRQPAAGNAGRYEAQLSTAASRPVVVHGGVRPVRRSTMRLMAAIWRPDFCA